MSDAERVPPHSQEAETAVLGAILLEPKALSAVLPNLQAESFYRADHQKVYAAFVTLFNADVPIDIISVREGLRQAGHDDIAGNSDLFVTLSGAVPSIANAGHYAKIIVQKAALRKAIVVCNEVLIDAYDENMVALGAAPTKMMHAAASAAWKQPYDMAERIVQMVEAADAGREVGKALATGIGKIDVVTKGGWRAGELWIIGGRPGTGKSALVTNFFAKGIAFERRMAVFSLEVPGDQFASNLLAHVARANTQNWPDKTPGEWERVLAAAKKLAGEGCKALRDCLLDDTAGLSPSVLHAKVEQFAADGPVDVVFVDHLQLMVGDPGEKYKSTNDRVSVATRTAKLLARKFETRVVVLSQLSRESAKQGRLPRLDDLRDSGASEQNADIVLLMNANPKDRDDRVHAYRHDIIVAKQRSGPCGTLRFDFIPEHLTFIGHKEGAEPVTAAVAEPEPEEEEDDEMNLPF